MSKKFMVMVILSVLFFLAMPAGSAMAGFSFGFSANKGGVNNFYVAVSDYNRVPQNEVVAIRNRGIPDEELPVVYYLAAKANVRPNVIVDMRLRHMAWMDIAFKFHLSPDVFYVPVKTAVHGGPYEGYYKHYNVKKNRWNKIRLTDEEVVNSVNLRFASEHYGYSPEEVIKMRSNGKNFVAIHEDLRAAKNNNAGHGHEGHEEGKSRDHRDYNH